MEDDDLLRILAVLSTRSRFDIHMAIARAGPDGTTPAELGKLLGLQPSLLSAHLTILASAGLVTAHWQDRRRIYRVAPGRFSDFAAAMQRLGNQIDAASVPGVDVPASSHHD